MKKDLERRIAEACKELFGAEVMAQTGTGPAAGVELTRPEEQFGDFSTNIALRLAAGLGRKPRDIADELASRLHDILADQVSEVTVAGPGFINLTLNDAALLGSLDAKPSRAYDGQEVLVEFGDPNPFKSMHIGHLYSYIVGDAISSLLEAAGAKVKRLSYHGDVGLHVAKALWAMRQDGISDDIGASYAKGAQAYEQDAKAKEEIDRINAQIYAGDPELKELYEEGKKRSFAGFDHTLTELGIKNDKRYLESESAPAGLELVKENTGKVFTESDGAVIYEGEKAGLHTRVFITGKGLPTYETKDLGLTVLKDRDYPGAGLSIIITAHEQAEYFKVMLAALKEINPATAKKTRHLSHGFVSLSSGKMSSRTGQVYGAVDLLADVEQAAQKLFPGTAREVRLGAVKYAFARHRLGSDLIYDVDESISLEGNSGPYLQYAHARACSILRKAGHETDAGTPENPENPEGPENPEPYKLKGQRLEPDERPLVRKLAQYPEAIDRAVNELMPHHVCTYLYELAQTFNRFYERNRVIGDPRQDIRLELVRAYARRLQFGLNLLGITAPEKM